MDEDLITLKYNDNAPEVQDGLKYVAYRIRAFMMKNCFAKRNARNLTEKVIKQMILKDYVNFRLFI